jgi:hypothetical protein
VARSGTAGAMEVSPMAKEADDRNATLRFAPTPPNCTGRPHRAGASSSRQPSGDGFPEDWCTGLERPEVPWQTVERARSEYNDWQEFLEVGASVQRLLREAERLHTNVAAPLFRVRVFVSSLLSSSFHSHLSLIQVLYTSFVLATAALQRRGQNHPHRQPAHCCRGGVPGERPFAPDDRSSPRGSG